MARITRYLTESTFVGYFLSTALIVGLGYGLNNLFTNRNSLRAEKPQTAEIERARDLTASIDFYPPSFFHQSNNIAKELLSRERLEDVCQGARLAIELQTISAMSKAGNVLKFNSTTGDYDWLQAIAIPYQTIEANSEVEDLRNRVLQLQAICGK